MSNSCGAAGEQAAGGGPRELEKNSVFLQESAIWPPWDGTSCSCWCRGVNSVDAQRQWWQARGEERKNYQVQKSGILRLCTDGGCVPWTRCGASVQYPTQQEFCGPVYRVANDYRKSLYYFSYDVQISVIYS